MSIVLDQVTKQYQATPVVNDVSLDIAEGEFFVLLGPSGSGKSTLLRAIAGLTGIDHGRINLRGRDVTSLSAREREVGFVFQNYALFRHMTVAENIEFGLSVRRVRAAERARRRRELLELIGLAGLDDRLPAQLSGGQQQRVAVARALAHAPRVLLLDEPFGALDAKIREELRRTIRRVQKELGITTILVTHDQEEAFAMGDRIGVMHLGRLLEAGRPTELYSRPATRFVATFLGAANLLLRRQSLNGTPLPPRHRRAVTAPGATRPREHEVVAVLRPEEVELVPAPEAAVGHLLGRGHVEEIVFTGALERLRVRMPTEDPVPAIPGCVDCTTSVLLEVTRTQAEQRAFPLRTGQGVAIAARRIHVLPTPLSSFTVFATGEGDAAALSRHPWLNTLATQMQTRIAARIEADLGAPEPGPATDSIVGVSVIATGPGCARQVDWLLANQAEEILCLSGRPRPPARVVIYCATAAARRATLAVAASLLRHVPAEAVYVQILPAGEAAGPPATAVRELLDVRSEAKDAHGLDVRTELRFGAPADALLAELERDESGMLILGIDHESGLTPGLAALLDRPAAWPVLLV
jgi:sulfate transport system ATP-binding protein